VSASLLEIVDLGNGEIVLQPADEGSEPLLTIRFSEASQRHMMDQYLEVAKVMIQAGIEAVALLADEEEEDVLEAETYSEAPRTLH